MGRRIRHLQLRRHRSPGFGHAPWASPGIGRLLGMHDDSDSGGKGGREPARDIGRTRLGNPANGNAPRPQGAVRVLMIGDMIGKPGRDRGRGAPAGAARRARHRLRDRQRRERRRRDGPDARRPRTRSSPRASTSSPAATTSGTSARSTRTSRRTTASCGRSTTARTRSRAAAGAPTRRSTAPTSRSINLQGRTYMQQIENPFTDADRLLDESSEPLPPVRLVDFHCELTSEKNALGLYLDGRVSVVVGTHTHVVTGDERILPERHRLPDRPRHDRAGLERHRVRRRGPSCRASSTPCRRASRWARGPSSSTPSRSTSTRPPAGPSPIERIQRLVEA